eukprot:2743019-Rhodomonas_salina.1
MFQQTERKARSSWMPPAAAVDLREMARRNKTLGAIERMLHLSSKAGRAELHSLFEQFCGSKEEAEEEEEAQHVEGLLDLMVELEVLSLVDVRTGLRVRHRDEGRPLRREDGLLPRSPPPSLPPFLPPSNYTYLFFSSFLAGAHSARAEGGQGRAAGCGAGRGRRPRPALLPPPRGPSPASSPALALPCPMVFCCRMSGTDTAVRAGGARELPPDPRRPRSLPRRHVLLLCCSGAR